MHRKNTYAAWLRLLKSAACPDKLHRITIAMRTRSLVFLKIKPQIEQKSVFWRRHSSPNSCRYNGMINVTIKLQNEPRPSLVYGIVCVCRFMCVCVFVYVSMS